MNGSGTAPTARPGRGTANTAGTADAPNTAGPSGDSGTCGGPGTAGGAVTPGEIPVNGGRPEKATEAAETSGAGGTAGNGGKPGSGGGVAYRRMSVERRRAQLLGAALRLFAHRAPEDVSLDDVAQAAEVSRPLVYRYFPGGKQQLYEAALRSAADELELCFAEPQTGPLSRRLSRALDRYLAFVDQHDAGFTALLQGGSVAETSRTNAIVDEVRRAAAEQILLHLKVHKPGQRLRMMVRTWITAVEAASLIWLDEGKQPPAAELRDWLVDHFVVLLTATAAGDPQTARVAAVALAMERADGPVGSLARRVVPLVSGAAHLL